MIRNGSRKTIKSPHLTFQNAPGYGGYPTNPVGSGGATNPYYTSPDGLELGPVNVNPLFSFQVCVYPMISVCKKIFSLWCPLKKQTNLSKVLRKLLITVYILQAGTTDEGELALKPLVNLHLVPNGCGILGCKVQMRRGQG